MFSEYNLENRYFYGDNNGKLINLFLFFKFLFLYDNVFAIDLIRCVTMFSHFRPLVILLSIISLSNGCAWGDTLHSKQSIVRTESKKLTTAKDTGISYFSN